MRRLTCVVSLVTILFAVSNASAQQTNTSTVPNLISYSGTLAQARNVAVPSRTVGVTFAIYKQQEGGAPVWLETQNVTVDSSGHYSVLLGSTRAEGMPADLFSAQEERWLGVKAEGQAEQARVMLVSVPYAFKAHEAETLGGMPASAFALAVQSSSASAANTAIVSEAATQSAGVRTGFTQGHGTKGYVPLWLNSLYLGNSALFQDSNKNVGIGTTTPAATLHVNGGIIGANFDISGNGTAGGMLSANGVNTATNYMIGGSPVLSIAGGANVFLGPGAGGPNPAGFADTMVGSSAGYNNSSGQFNVFVGSTAGLSNTTGNYNTFSGTGTGLSNIGGSSNTFSGAGAGYFNTSGSYNAFYGSTAGHNNTTSCCNTFIGEEAGSNNTTGSYNNFYGYQAGTLNTAGDGNIYIANYGSFSVESNTIRIGTPGSGQNQQNIAYIAGIYGSTSSGGVAVYINSAGQLGTLTSSRRFKEQIRDMGDSSTALMKLRPVTYFYKPEYDKGPRTLQYGLIVEEVAEVYPELVAYEEDGKPYTVKYQYLTTMLLNEMQKQYHRAEAQAEVIQMQQQEIDGLKAQLRVQNASMQERLSRLESMMERQTQTAVNLPQK